MQIPTTKTRVMRQKPQFSVLIAEFQSQISWGHDTGIEYGGKEFFFLQILINSLLKV